MTGEALRRRKPYTPAPDSRIFSVAANNLILWGQAQKVSVLLPIVDEREYV